MKKIIGFFIFATFIFSSFIFHEFYTSMTKIEYTSTNKILKIATKVDVEQIENVINKNIESPENEILIKNYLYKNVGISINNQTVKYEFTGKQLIGDVLWIYYQIDNVTSINNIEVKNTLFMDKNPNQQNFISINIDGKKSSFVCTKAKDSDKKQL